MLVSYLLPKMLKFFGCPPGSKGAVSWKYYKVHCHHFQYLNSLFASHNISAHVMHKPNVKWKGWQYSKIHDWQPGMVRQSVTVPKASPNWKCRGSGYRSCLICKDSWKWLRKCLHTIWPLCDSIIADPKQIRRSNWWFYFSKHDGIYTPWG